MKPLIIALVLSLVPLCTQAQQFDEPLASLNPSETLVLRLLPYAQEVQVDVEYGHGRSLTTQAREALALAPSWIRPALFDTLSRLDLVNQAAISELITLAYAEDPRYVDEVAFSIAHLPMEDLLYDNPTFHTSFDPELLMENVRGIYAAGEFIHFASLVERLEGTDQAYTTVLLTMADGEWEVPRDMYYWYVVHPRLADDSALYIDPRTGNPSPRDERGVFWRTMVWAEDPDPDYTFPSTLKAPSAVDNLSDYTADGGLEIPGADAVIEVAGPGGEPLMLHYARGRGMVYATTLPVENSSGPLMENLVSAGFGHGSVLAPYLGEPVLLLKERNPFMDNVVEEYLQAEGFDFTVLDSTGITALSGEADLAGFKKIIIAGDQPLSLYLALEAQADIFEAWLDTYASKVLLFLGAMDSGHEADDWSQTTLPLGFTRVNQGNLLTGTPRGYPTFRQVITLGASAPGNYVWDGAAHANLSGQRFFSDQDMVLDRLGYLVSQTLELNVSEIPAEYRGPDGDCPSCSVVRSPYPQRIIYQHYGNCGELQDTGMAFGRTALIPSAGVGGITEDHVWNEFYLDDQWVPFQVSWSDSDTFIAVPGNIQDKDYGGGKDLAVVYRTRPDGKWENVTERYSNTFTVNFHVEDAAGHPVEGAEILLASENWYDPSQLNVAIITHTDHLGDAPLALGDFQNFYVRISSGAGIWPDETSVQWVVCADASAQNPSGSDCPATAPWDPQLPMILGDTADATYEIRLTLEGMLPAKPTVTVALPLTEQELASARSQVTYTYDPQSMRAIHRETGGASYTDDWEFAAAPDGWIFDEENLQRYLAGEDATALAALTADGTAHRVPLPGTSPYFATLSNDNSWGSTLYLSLAVSVEPYTPEETTDITPGGSGCSCTVSGAVPRPGPLWIFGLLALWLYRKRILTST